MKGSELSVVAVAIGVLGCLIIYIGIRKIRALYNNNVDDIILVKSSDGKDIYLNINKSPAQLFSEKRARSFRERAKAAAKVRGASSTREEAAAPSQWDEALDDSKFADDEFEA